MAAKKHPRKKENEQDQEERHQPRPFWSGVIAFGLVSLPVSLFPANRGRPVSLRMVDAEGNPLRRRYYNEKKNQMLERDDLVRGYPIEGDQYVLVEDEELEALAPEKSREIDLQRFVPVGDINPVYFERGYFLAPDSDATKAYRLLAKALEDEQRAGIATFVMRDREYLIAIMSEGGILRAETLRFQDEIRSPRQVGLPEQLPEPGKQQLAQVRKAIRARSRKTLDPDQLVEQQIQALRELVDRKLAENQDVVAKEPEQEPAEDSNVVDLMQVLKERLQGTEQAPKPAKGGGSKRRQERPDDMSRDELYEQAREKHIAGRSKMTKQELLRALRKAG
ncbi:MAG: Ku protein [Marinobacter sp.]